MASFCYYPSGEHEWALGRVVQERGASVEVEDAASGEKAVVDAGRTLPASADAADAAACSDLLEIPSPHEAKILHCLRARFADGKPSTRLGRAMVQLSTGEEPVCSLASEAYRRLLEGGGSQVVAVMGAASSDKHLFTSSALKSLFRCGRAPKAACSALQSCLALLRWFGSVRTLRGSEVPCYAAAWRLSYDAGGALAGASLSTAGLERSRILSCTDTERMFTAAYMLLSGRDASKYLAASTAFPQMTDGVAPDGQDKVDYEKAVSLCQVLGVEPKTRDGLWRLVSAALHIGALELVTVYAPAGAAVRVAPDSQTSLRLAGGLLGVDPTLLGALITGSRAPAVARDSLACAVYAALFGRVVTLVNDTLASHFGGRSGSGAAAATSLGVVSVLDAPGNQEGSDLFGVEELLRHSVHEVFEGRYRSDVLERPRVEARVASGRSAAGGGAQGCPGPASADVLGVLFGPGGLVERLGRSGTDSKLYDGVVASRSPLLYSAMRADAADDDASLPFVVRHTFGEVGYDACGFTAASAALSPAALELLVSAPPLGRDISNTSAVAGVQAFVREAVAILDAAAAVRWVRCVAPSATATPAAWSGAYVAAELRRAGVTGAAQFAAQSHDASVGCAAFVRRYASLGRLGAAAYAADDAEDGGSGCRALARELGARATRSGVLASSAMLRRLDALLMQRASQLLVAFARTAAAGRRCAAYNPRARVKAALLERRKLARVEGSRRQLVRTEEQSYRTYAEDQFSRRLGALSERSQQAIVSGLTRRLAALVDLEEKRRKSVSAQNDIWFRGRWDEFIKVAGKWLKRQKKALQVAVVDSAPHCLDVLAQNVAERAVRQQQQLARMAKETYVFCSYIYPSLPTPIVHVVPHAGRKQRRATARAPSKRWRGCRLRLQPRRQTSASVARRACTTTSAACSCAARARRPRPRSAARDTRTTRRPPSRSVPATDARGRRARPRSCSSRAASGRRCSAPPRARRRSGTSPSAAACARSTSAARRGRAARWRLRRRRSGRRWRCSARGWTTRRRRRRRR